ncbi:MAG: aminopeptidase P family protein [Pseudomonadaceae bacterium]|nr:aminopeptidase P family protein [Pseudomonadaceae bacterium]
MKTPAKLIFENGANWRYATGTPISDPALWYMEPNGTTHILVSELEIALMQTTATGVTHIHGFAEVRDSLHPKPLTLSAMVAWLHRATPEAPLLVPADFPAATFQRLTAEGLPLEVCTDDLFFPERAIKTLAETEKLAEAERAATQCFHRAAHILREADIARDASLVWKGKPLTAETVQMEMRKIAIEQGCEEFHGGPIVACGAQGAMPHERGHGILKAHELIVIDNFPRHKNGYWADCTRTFVKGKTTQWQQDVYAAVLTAQEAALALIRQGANGRDIHKAVETTLHRAGFPTGSMDDGTPYGFFHGTGHGVGLELHEPGPRMISRADCELKSGYVTSVEPGLYYPPGSHKGGTGGCRIEDLVVVTDTGHHNLTLYPKNKWMID